MKALATGILSLIDGALTWFLFGMENEMNPLIDSGWTLVAAKACSITCICALGLWRKYEPAARAALEATFLVYAALVAAEIVAIVSTR